MNNDPNDALSAFLDGEPVENGALAEALARPGGREALVDYVLLRGAASGDVHRPSESFYDRMDTVLDSREDRRPWWMAAAAAVLVVAALGIWSIRPTPTDTDATQPAPSATQPAPSATRTLHFERGVDWQGQG